MKVSKKQRENLNSFDSSEQYEMFVVRIFGTISYLNAASI